MKYSSRRNIAYSLAFLFLSMSSTAWGQEVHLECRYRVEVPSPRGIEAVNSTASIRFNEASGEIHMNNQKKRGSISGDKILIDIGTNNGALYVDRVTRDIGIMMPAGQERIVLKKMGECTAAGQRSF